MEMIYLTDISTNDCCFGKQVSYDIEPPIKMSTIHLSQVHSRYTTQFTSQGLRHRQCIESKTASFSVLDYKETQRAIAITCIGYLASGWHRDWKAVEESGRLGMLNMKHPFLDYAANNWRKHLRKSGAEDTNVASLLDSLLLKDFEILPVLLKLTNEIELKGLELFNSRQKNLFVSWEAIHVAAAEGLGFYVEYLIGKGHNIESSNSVGHTPLALAARKGHHDVVAILIRNGARSDEADEVGLKPVSRGYFHNAAF